MIREERLGRGKAFSCDVLARAALADPRDVTGAGRHPDALRGPTDSGAVLERDREGDVEARELQLHRQSPLAGSPARKSAKGNPHSD